MKKLNNSIFQSIVLGLATSAAFGLAPASATQIVLPEPTYPPIDGARPVLDNCPNPFPVGTICDPNADVIGSGNGLSGRLGFNPSGTPGAIRLEGTNYVDGAGNPLTNIDFTPPIGGPNGRIITIDAPSGSEFEAFEGWKGTISDLYIPPFDNGGSPFPSDANPRLKNFIVIDDRTGARGNGTVDGVALGGFAMDFVYLDFPVYTAVGGSTTVSLPWELQVYKLDASGNRVEDQDQTLPNDFTAVYANRVQGAISATFAGLTPAQVRELFDEPGEFSETFTYDINLDSTVISTIIPQGNPIPEPTTILSSLLLFGGGALKLKNRK